MDILPVDAIGFMNACFRMIRESGFLFPLAGRINMNAMNRSFLRLRGVTFLVILALGLDGKAFAQVAVYGVEKQIDYLQNSSSAPTVNSGRDANPYSFHAFVQGNNIGGRTPAPTVTLPDSTTLNLIPGAGGFFAWSISNSSGDTSFLSKAALDAAYPNGIYSMSIGSVSGILLTLTPDSYPPAPQFTHGSWDSNGNLIINASAPYTFSFNTFPGYANGGFASFELDDGSRRVFKREIFSATGEPLLTSYTLPSNWLVPGTTYTGFMSYNQILTANAAAISGATGYAIFSRETNFSVTAVPEPKTYAMMLAGFGLAGFVARRRIEKGA